MRAFARATAFERYLNSLSAGPFEDAVAAASTAPAQLLGDPELGRIDVGLAADLVVLTDRLEIERVLVGGEVRVAA